MIRLYLNIKYYLYSRRNLYNRTFNEWLLWEYGRYGDTSQHRDTITESSSSRRRI